MNGVTVTISLMGWLNYVSMVRAAAAQSDEISDPPDSGNLDQFLDDGRDCYESLLSEVHGEIKQDRHERKMTKRWIKFSSKSQKKIAREMPFDPFETQDDSPVGPAEVGEWVRTGAIPTVEASSTDDDPDAPAA